MRKKLVRLTESDLHRIVKESVNRVLKEMEEGKITNNKPYFNASFDRKASKGQYAPDFMNTDKDPKAIEKHNERALQHYPDITGHDELAARQKELNMSKETGKPPHMFADTIQGKLGQKRQGEYYRANGYPPILSGEDQERRFTR